MGVGEMILFPPLSRQPGSRGASPGSTELTSHSDEGQGLGFYQDLACLRDSLRHGPQRQGLTLLHVLADIQAMLTAVYVRSNGARHEVGAHWSGLDAELKPTARAVHFYNIDQQADLICPTPQAHFPRTPAH